MSCPCDEHRCPSPFVIAAGLSTLPRSPGQFADFRAGMLAAVGAEPALDGWRAREPGDLGLMLLEMGAYVLDVTGFYDRLLAEESYIGTGRLAGTQRRHVALLGYQPRPATGSSVWLAVEADGTRLLKLPAGTAFRSGEFDGNPPQLFELEADAVVEPRVNRMAVERVPETLLPASFSGISVRAPSVRVAAGDLVVFDAGGSLSPAHVAGVSRLVVRTRDSVARIAFDAPITPPAGASYADARLLKGGSTCGAWKPTPASGEAAVISGAELSLDSRVNLHAGDIVALDDGTTAFAGHVVSVTETQYTFLSAVTSTITDSDGKTSTLVSPPIKVGVTRITLDAPLPFTATAVPTLVVYHAMVQAAALHAPLADTLTQSDPVSLPTLIDVPRTSITDLMLEDVHGEGVVTTGTLDASSHEATMSTTPAWGAHLTAPVQLYGNAVLATRGESVRAETLGFGDASAPTQTFRLKKKPLTYLPAANAAGRRSTLVIHVGGVRWQEVDTFFGANDRQTVYIVRHDDEGHTDVTFGGGARLHSGAPVVADYRFGAGGALPPAGSVKQVARPVAGLRRVRNVLAAFGGTDAEDPTEIAVSAPRSALLLGRAISLGDFEAAAVRQPGVLAARASWRWDARGLQPAVIVSYIGDPQLAPTIQATLRALAEDGAPITVTPAIAQSARLDVDVALSDLYVPDQVVAAVTQALFAAVTGPGTGGVLRAEKLGPDGVVFASVVVRAVMDVPGVVAFRGLGFDGTPFTGTGRSPAAGAYFDFAGGGVWVNGTRNG